MKQRASNGSAAHPRDETAPRRSKGPLRAALALVAAPFAAPLAALGIAALGIAAAAPGDANAETQPAPHETPLTIEEIRQAEQALYALGYAPGDPDGVFEASTAAALLQYQTDWKRPITEGLTQAARAQLAEDAANGYVLAANHEDCRIWTLSPALGGRVKWIGACENGYAEGPGVMVAQVGYGGQYEVGVLEGTFVAGRAEGFVRTRYASGARFAGVFVNGVAHGFGRASWPNWGVYRGQFADGLRHGVGVTVYQGGQIHKGGMAYDHLHGPGVFQFANGERYEGEFAYGQMEGQGRYFYTDGGVYIGGMRDGQFHGDAAYQMADGTNYTGRFVQNQLDGPGVLTHPNGDRFEGMFLAGEYSSGTYIRAGGSMYSGAWRNNLPNGFGIMIAVNGDVFAGLWTDGCFEQSGRRAAFFATNEDCALE